MSDLNMSRILLTGGAGFIGSNLVHWFLNRYPELHIVNLDLLTYAGDLKNLEGADPERHTLVRGNICDEKLVEGLFSEHGFDAVVHLAAESHVDRSIDGAAPFIQSNIIGTYTLLEAARKAWEGRSDVRFHHVSTDEVYGDLGPDDPAFTESTPYAPSSPYSASKASSDHLVRAWSRTYGLPITITNCSNNYGPRQHPEKLIPVVIRACAERRPIPVYGKGENIRDWLFVDDHCAAIDTVLRTGKLGQTYLVGGDNEWTNIKLVRKICKIVAEEQGVDEAETLSLITFVTDRLGHDRRYAVNSEKTKKLGWSPTPNFDEALRHTVRWYLAETR